MAGLREAFAQTLEALHFEEDFDRLGLLFRRTFAPDKVVVPVGPPRPPSPRVLELLNQNDRRLDVALGATLIAEEDAPETDPERVLDEVEALVCRLRILLRHAGADPRRRLETLNTFFFNDLGFSASAVRTSRYAEDRLADLLLPHVLRRRQGHCVGLSSAYLALGYRAGLPLYGVSAPNHFFVRWEGEGLRRNVELTARGAAHEDDYYVQRFRIREELVDRGVYLQNLRRREVLVEILNNRANFYWDRGDEARVIRDLDRVVQVSHNFARAYVGRGFVALQRGRLDAAKQDLRRALEIDPDSSRAHLLLGQAQLRQGFFEPAEESFERATELDPQNALAVTYLGRLYGIRGHHDRAREWHERAIKIDPRCHVAWNHLGLTQQAIGEVVPARRAFWEARRLVPHNLKARENLVLLSRGEQESIALWARPAFGGICKDYERLLRAEPEAIQARVAYVRFLLAAGRRGERALELARQVAAQAETTFHLELLARALALNGRVEDAVEKLERAIALDQSRGGGETRRLQQLQGDLRAAAA